MDAEQAWQSALGQLQMEMPKASFDTWVRDTRLVSYEEGLFTIAVCNAYARDWLESRLASTATRLLMGIMNRSVDVQFIVTNGQPSDEEDAIGFIELEHEMPGVCPVQGQRRCTEDRGTIVWEIRDRLRGDTPETGASVDSCEP